jgi:hypothetical protein
MYTGTQYMFKYFNILSPVPVQLYIQKIKTVQIYNVAYMYMHCFKENINNNT